MSRLQKKKAISFVIVILTILSCCLVLAACKKDATVKESVIVNDLDEVFSQYRAPSTVVQYETAEQDDAVVGTFTLTMSDNGATGLRVETLFKNSTLSYKIYLDEEHTQEATSLTYEVCQNDYYALVSAKGGSVKEYRIRLLSNRHDFVTVSASPAGCTEPEILVTHHHCTVCGKNFDDDYMEIKEVQGEAAKGHEYVKVDESCKYGTYYECSACSAIFEKGEDGAYTPIDDLPLSSDPTKHDYVVLDDPTHAATCTEAGLGIVRCRFCGDGGVKVPVLAKGHDFRVIEEERATCTQEGFKKLTCTACGYSKDEIIPARGHATENGFVAASAATCTEGGVVAHYDCARCNKHFADQAAARELSSVQSAPLGHDCAGHYDAGKAVGCVEDGTLAHYTCARCNKIFQDGEATTELTNVTVTRTGHDFIAHKSGVAPSCVTSGYVEYWRCKNCSSANTGFFTSIEDRFSNAYRKESLSELSLAPLGHSLDDDCRCTRCREVCHGTRFGDFCRHEEDGETYIYYGAYPQSRVTDAELCDVLTDKVGALPSAQNDRGWEPYSYYVGGELAEIGYYLDLEYKTVTYRAVYFTALRPDFTRGNVEDLFYNQTANGYQTDTLYFFSFDPVKWRVLSQDGSKAMLFCTCLLDSREYYNDVATREGTAGTLYANDYAESALRAWLNDEFYQTAFDDVSGRILVTTVKNGATDANPNDNVAAFNGGVNAYVCADAEDIIFLLSEREVTDAAFGFDADHTVSDQGRILCGSDYAKAQGLWIDQGKNGGSCWWLRSPDASVSDKVMRVGSDGNADGSYRDVTFTAYGVAPALWVDLCPEGHDFGVGWIIDVVATCSANGLRHRTCVRCAVTEEERTVQAHSYRDGVCTLCGAPSTEKLSADGFFVGAAQDTLYFGTYPQIEVLDGELIASLNLSAGALPTKGDPKGWTLYGYAQKGQAADPMWYIDLEMGGEAYRGVYFSAYRASDPARSVDSYATQRDNGYYAGTIYWFRFEPVKWRVLQKDGGTWLLLADLLLDAQPFDDDANGYAQSTVRAFLNERFYDTAFDATQKQYILVTTVKNDLASTNPASGTFGSSNPYVSADTEDRVFLLSEREATSYSLGAYSDESTARRRFVTDYAAAQGAYRNDGSEYPQYRGLGWYWLRSPRSAAENESRYVLNSGRSDAAATVTRTDIGVLPALRVDLCKFGHDLDNEDKACPYCGFCFETEGLTYSASGNDYVVSGYTGTDEEVWIPAVHQGKKVVRIATDAFKEQSHITSVRIPDSVTSIGSSAFDGCSGLTSITIPNGVTSIGYAAFYYCSGLTSVTFAENSQLTSIGSYAFYKCSSLSLITIPDSVTSIGSSAFSGCSGLTSVTFAENSQLTSIGSYAFYKCSSLTSVTFAENSQLTSIGEYAFYECNGLTSVTFAENSQLTSVGYAAFYYCSGLTSITIPDGVTSIGSYAFRGCSALTSIIVEDGNTVYKGDGNCLIEKESKTLLLGCKNSVIPTDGSVTSIGIYAFEYCSSLTSITIPDSVTSIGYGAFEYCESLISVTIGSGVTSIGGYAFFGCYKLVEVCNLSSLSITKGSNENGWISSYAKEIYTAKQGSKVSKDEDGFVFYNDGEEKILMGYVGNQTDLLLPNSATSIYSRAFYSSRLTSVTIPDSVTSIGNYAFYGSKALTKVSIGKGVNVISSFAFSRCDALTSISVKEGNDTYHSAGNCVIATKSKTLTVGCKSSQIPEDGSVTSIGSYAFYDCRSLTSITIPNSVTSIGIYAFEYCGSLISVTIGSGVTSIGGSAFSSCSSLTSITIPNSVTSIGDYAFRSCSGLSSITIPSSVKSIGYRTFYECNNLTSVTFNNPNGWWVASSSLATSGTAVSLNDPAANAALLTDTYEDYYWKRS